MTIASRMKRPIGRLRVPPQVLGRPLPPGNAIVSPNQVRYEGSMDLVTQTAELAGACERLARNKGGLRQ